MVPSRERGERGRGEKGAWHSRGGRWRHTSRRGSIVTSTGDGTPAPSYHLGVYMDKSSAQRIQLLIGNLGRKMPLMDGVH